ncbi:MAG: GntR family transcriptional regulator [bacterium]|nr:GntR family transcriptional regulator [bacterium]MDI1344203.1 GntR family transcriptional regulator [Pseudolabrys sp.]
MASLTQSDQAYTEIRRRILILEVRPEERLKEEEWARKLEIGRLAVREALTRLHGEGLVTRGLKGGFFAAGMAPEDVREIREVREILEVAAIRLARERISESEIKEMEATCDDFAYMVKKGYHTGAWEADRRFHQLLIAASGNNRLRQAYEHCHIPLFQVRIGQSREYIEDYELTEREHREIVAVLKSGHIDKAVELLRSHLARGANDLLSSMTEKVAAD